MQPVAPSFEWTEPVTELIGFVAQFLALGAVGFRVAALRNVLADAQLSDTQAAGSAASLVAHDSALRAARLGLVGFLVEAALFAWTLPSGATRAHQTLSEYILSLQVGLACVLFVIGVAGLAWAAVSGTRGWTLATIGVLLATLTGILGGQWARLVNPVHRVVAGLWIGTLFVLVTAGLGTVLRDTRAKELRGKLAAEMVNGFSPLALTCGMLVVASGLTTAFKHLNPFSALWTTSYGYALLVKLALVAVVFALGAWNWQRQRPLLGSEDAAHAIRKSARAEIAVAALVLMVTAVLVSLPSPRPPGPPPGGGPHAPANASPPPT